MIDYTTNNILDGKTERCLSYDERPLQLFQRLKEQGQQPVFMLRHVKELRLVESIRQVISLN